MDKKPRIPRCQDCKAPCTGDFKRVLDLQNSGLIIYAHNAMGKRKQKNSMKDETYIFHNTSDKDLKRPAFINELCTFRTKCFQCKTIIQRVRSLLDEIATIRSNEALGLCDYCKRSNPAGKCKKCEFIVKKFLCNKVKQYEDRQTRFKSWLSKVRDFLQGILETDKICSHKLYQESNSTAELEKVLQELRSPLKIREPDIRFFPDTESGRLSLESLTESKILLEQFLSKLKSSGIGRRYSSDESLYVSPSKTSTTCVCKYFMNKKFEERRSMEILVRDSLLPKLNREKPVETKKKADSKEVIPIKTKDVLDKLSKEMPSKITENQTKAKLPKGKILDKENIPPEKTGKDRKSQKHAKDFKVVKPAEEPKSEKPVKDSKVEKSAKDPKSEKQAKELKPKKPKLTSQEQLFLNLMKEKQKEKQKQKIEKVSKQDKPKLIPKIDALPELKVREKAISIVQEVSESVVACGDQHAFRPGEMIKGKKIVPYDPHHKDEAIEFVIPMLYKVKSVFSEPMSGKSVSPAEISAAQNNKLPDVKPLTSAFRYELSNHEFIDKGWTVLPTTKIMRRMNIYKMEPCKHNWFERHKCQKEMFYDSGEKLAEIDDQGCGKWLYKNGRVALDYYNDKESNGSQRYVVYSSGEECENGKTLPVTVLASFDYNGNGVVYDHYGNVRLKYNQSEGMVVDEKIGPPGRWKWHTLNDPPVLQPIFVNTHLKSRTPCLDKFFKIQKEESDLPRLGRKPNAEMLAIELDNFVKEKANKMLQKFKPFQIRMKVLKLNEQFSLRVLDQANIYLLFRNPPISLKLNLGMTLISNEIIDTDTAEVSQVATPYDQLPPKSQSVADIQQILNRAKKIRKLRARKSYSATETLAASKSTNN